MMRSVIVILLLIPALCLGAESLVFTANPDIGSTADVQVSNNTRTAINFALGGLSLEPATIGGHQYTNVLPLESDLTTAGYIAEEGKPDLPTYSSMVIIPDQGGARVNIISSDYRTYDNMDISPTQPSQIEGQNETLPFTLDRSVYNDNKFYPEDLVQVGEPAILRDFRFVQVTVQPVQYNPVTRQMRVYTNINYELVYDGSDTRNTIVRKDNNISEAFLPLYKSLFVNSWTLLANFTPVKGAYLILVPNNTQFPADTINVFARWKHLKGYKVKVARSNEILPAGNPNVTQVKAYIQTYYDTAVVKPDYLMIVGDIDVTNCIPVNSYGGYTSDHQYSQLAGSDYLPDIFVTRMSVASIAELRSAMYKALTYEKTPYMGETGYWKRGLVVAGNISATSPRLTVLWVRSLMLQNGFTQVDSVFDWGSGAPNQSTIGTALNNGISFLAYRGWAGSNGWYNPPYTVADLDGQTAGLKIGIMTSLVCGTGDYGASLCFGEQWIRGGSAPSSFRGGPCFMGNTNHGTHTRWNNPVMQGFYHALFDQGIYHFGQDMVMGKMRDYTTYTHYNYMGGKVNEYFNTYNGLGDPELEVRTEIPRTLAVTCPSTIPVGTNFLTVQVNGVGGTALANAYVSLVKGYGANEEIFTGGLTDNSGSITLNFHNTVADTIFVTVTSREYIPYRGFCLSSAQAVSLNSDSIQINDSNGALTHGNNDGKANPAETIGLNIRLRNFGTSTTATGIYADLNALDSRAIIVEGHQTYPDIASGNTAFPSDQFIVTLANNITHGDKVPLQLVITSSQGTWQARVLLTVNSIKPTDILVTLPGDGNGRLDPNQVANMVVSFKNSGLLSGDNITGTLTCLDRYITIQDADGTFGTIGINSTGDNNSDPFVVVVNDSAYAGRNVNFTLEGVAQITNIGAVHFTKTFSMTIGLATASDPLGPDNYGYYMYDNTDLSYSPAPTYSWIEINPNHGGSGGTAITFSNTDDASALVTLPFTFRYYGHNYNHMIVCINGFAAFDTIPYDVAGNYWMNWENWSIPDPGNARAQIDPFWDDLKIQNSGAGVYTRYDAAQGRYIIEWSDMTHSNSGSGETFQMIVYNTTTHPTPTGDCEFDFQYNVINNDDAPSSDTLTDPNTYSSVGFENWEESDGLQYEYDNGYGSGGTILASGLAIRVTTRTGLSSVPQPNLAYSPSNFNLQCQHGEQVQGNLILTNNGNGNLTFSARTIMQSLLKANHGNNSNIGETNLTTDNPAPQEKGKDVFNVNPPMTAGSGGPDSYGYRWKDSDESGGPTFHWVDIRTIGTPITITGSRDDVTLTGFPVGFTFNYYGNNYTTMNICTNGWLSFTSTSNSYSNVPLPSGSAPVNQLAVYWDDLNLDSAGTIYRYTNNHDTCIVAWVGVPGWRYEGSFTFEVIMLASGQFVYQYQEATGSHINSETIGIQNGDATIGLTVANNAAYVEPGLAILFTFIPPVPPWLSISQTSGTIAAHSVDTIIVHCSAVNLSDSVYTGSVAVQTNDRHNPSFSVPITFTVGGQALGHITGIVKEIDNTTPIVTVIVKTYGSGHVLVGTDTTGGDGKYVCLGLTPGTYSEEFSKSGYRDTTLASLTVVTADTTRITMLMKTTTAPCSYLLGDINGDDLIRGGDVTFGVRYFKGLGTQPVDSCFNDSVTTPNHWLYVSSDVNGDCQFKGSDITRLVSYFKGVSSLTNCRFFPSGLIKKTPNIIHQSGSKTGHIE